MPEQVNAGSGQEAEMSFVTGKMTPGVSLRPCPTLKGICARPYPTLWGYLSEALSCPAGCLFHVLSWTVGCLTKVLSFPTGCLSEALTCPAGCVSISEAGHKKDAVCLASLLFINMIFLLLSQPFPPFSSHRSKTHSLWIYTADSACVSVIDWQCHCRYIYCKY